MTTTGVSLDGNVLSDIVPSAIVLAVRRPLVGRRRHVEVDVPGRAGSWIFPEEPGDRVVEFDVHVTEESFEDRREAVRLLAGWADVGDRARLVFDDEPDRFHSAILDTDATPAEWLRWSTIPLSFKAEPFAFALDESEEILALSGSSPKAGTFSAPDELAAEPIIEITPNNGTITAFGLELNGMLLGWSGLLPEDSALTISTISDTVTTGTNTDVDLTGAYDPDLVDMADVSGVFPYIVAGSNAWSFEWSGTATDITIEITWRRKFR